MALHFNEIDDDCLVLILNHLSPYDLRRISCVCRRLQHLADSDAVWREHAILQHFDRQWIENPKAQSQKEQYVQSLLDRHKEKWWPVIIHVPRRMKIRCGPLEFYSMLRIFTRRSTRVDSISSQEDVLKVNMQEPTVAVFREMTFNFEEYLLLLASAVEWVTESSPDDGAYISIPTSKILIIEESDRPSVIPSILLKRRGISYSIEGIDFHRFNKTLNRMEAQADGLNKLGLILEHVRLRKKIWSKIHLRKGDLTLEQVDAIVNPVDSSMMGRGSMVSGAIHRRAGPLLYDHCRTLEPCDYIGQTRVTPGYNLKANKIIHVCGPVIWSGSQPRHGLQFAYQNVLLTAIEEDCRSISFPAMGTGSGGFDCSIACKDAVEALVMFLSGYTVTEPMSFDQSEEEDYIGYVRMKRVDVDSIEEINLVCYDNSGFENPYPEFLAALRHLLRWSYKHQWAKISTQ